MNMAVTKLTRLWEHVRVTRFLFGQRGPCSERSGDEACNECGTAENGGHKTTVRPVYAREELDWHSQAELCSKNMA